MLAPFNERVWLTVLAPAPGVDLFSTFLKHRGALLVAAGALQSTPAVRRWLGRDPKLLQQIVVQWPGAFTQAALGLDLREPGIVVPGGAERDAAWTALVGAPPSRPEEFLRRLLARDDGRLARFYGVLARLDAARLTALLQPMPGENATTALSALYETAREAEAPWDANLHPFQLSYADLFSVLHSLNDMPIDRLPVSAGWWPALLRQNIDTRDDAAALVRASPAAAPFAASVRAMLSGAPRRRRDQVAMIAIARRTWSDGLDPASTGGLVYALGQFSRYPGAPADARSHRREKPRGLGAKYRRRQAGGQRQQSRAGAEAWRVSGRAGAGRAGDAGRQPERRGNREGAADAG